MTSRFYTSKEFWKPVEGVRCLHCSKKIEYKPYTLGTGISPHNGRSIITKGLFDTWLCVRRYAIYRGLIGENVDKLTTQIMQDFSESCGKSEDINGHKFIRNYRRFSLVPPAPERDEFEPYGGPISYEKFEKTWMSMIPTEPERASMKPFTKPNLITTDPLSHLVKSNKTGSQVPKIKKKATPVGRDPFVSKTKWTDI